MDERVEFISTGVENALVEACKCRKCGLMKPRSLRTPGWCEDCEKAYNSRYTYLRTHGNAASWVEVAKESGLELWERQPGETQLEWTIWQTYRDSYPGSKPSYKAVATKVDTTYDFVRKTAARWTFQVRMQAWIAECDRITMAQRRREVLDMNAAHIAMAEKLRKKLDAAIDNIRPDELKPSDLNSLMKTMADLEKKARVDTITVETQMAESVVDNENPELKQSPTKQGDLGEVVKILLAAGALGEITQIGVRKTETTEVVMRDADGNEVSHEST